MIWNNLNPGFNVDDYVGFVYKITNIETGRYYIGQKKFWFKRKMKPLKGRKNSRHKLVESDWKDYYGSAMELQNDVRRFGKDKFERVIIRLCESKSEMNYYETKEQFINNVLFDPLSYNGIINCRISKRHMANCKQ